MVSRDEYLQNKENGNVIVLFAFMLVVIIILMGFVVDIGLMYSKRNYLTEVGNLAREARFSALPYITQAEDPQKALDEVIERCLVKNGIPKSQFSAKFVDYRYNIENNFKMDIYLWDTYEYKFLKIFGIKEQRIEVCIPGGAYTSATEWDPWNR